VSGSSPHQLNGGGETCRKKLMRDVTGLVLLSYTLFVFNPIMPIFADIVAHMFWEKEHLMTVHKFHGKSHVHFDLLNASKQADKDKSSGNFKNSSEDYVHLIYNTVYNFSSTYVVTNSYYLPVISYPTSHLDIDYPPPRLNSLFLHSILRFKCNLLSSALS